MITEPERKRAIAFIDGQNLFYAAKEAFGYSYPNVNPQGLANEICAAHGWELVATHYYTGVPAAKDDPTWHEFWAAKLGAMKNWGVKTFSRPLRYRKQTVVRRDGSTEVVRVGQEKGVDIRIALDIVHLAHSGKYDVALVFSQDQDLSEVAKELRTISQSHSVWLKIASAFPVGQRTTNRRGINGADWIPIDRTLFDRCLDAKDYRPKADADAEGRGPKPMPKPKAGTEAEGRKPMPKTEGHRPAPKPRPVPKTKAESRRPTPKPMQTQAPKLQERVLAAPPLPKTAPLKPAVPPAPKKRTRRGRRGGRRGGGQRAAVQIPAKPTQQAQRQPAPAIRRPRQQPPSAAKLPQPITPVSPARQKAPAPPAKGHRRTRRGRRGGRKHHPKSQQAS